MNALLAADMQAGSLGLSTGLEYDPGIYSSTDELVQLSRVASQYGGVYVSHMRSEDVAIDDALAELATIAREAKIPAHISHLKLALLDRWGQAPQLLQRLDAWRAQGLDITADAYPYTYWHSGLTVLFPKRDFTDLEAARYVLAHTTPADGLILARFTAAAGLRRQEPRADREEARHLARADAARPDPHGLSRWQHRRRGRSRVDHGPLDARGRHCGDLRVATHDGLLRWRARWRPPARLRRLHALSAHVRPQGSGVAGLRGPSHDRHDGRAATISAIAAVSPRRCLPTSCCSIPRRCRTAQPSRSRTRSRPASAASGSMASSSGMAPRPPARDPARSCDARRSADATNDAAERRGMRRASAGLHHFSANGRASTSSDHADLGWCASQCTVSATSAGAIKNASGLSGIAWRVRGRSTTPSTMISAT